MGGLNLKKVIALSLGDLRNIRRELILSVSIFAPILLTIVVRFLIPILSSYLSETIGLNLIPHYPFILSYTLLLTPLLIGTAAGFLILEEKDEDLLKYFTITPLSRRGYITYRLLSPLLLSTIFSFFLLFLSNIVVINYVLMIPVVLMSSLEASLMALILGTFADNKVEGLAISKGMGIFFVAPAVGYFIKSIWRWSVAIIPPFWVSETFLLSGGLSQRYLLSIAMGFILHFICIQLVYRRFIK